MNSINAVGAGGVAEQNDHGDHGAVNMVQDKWNGIPYIAWVLLSVVVVGAVTVNAVWCYCSHRKTVAKKAMHSAVATMDLDDILEEEDQDIEDGRSPLTKDTVYNSLQPIHESV